jgi:hypothetical protein
MVVIRMWSQLELVEQQSKRSQKLYVSTLFEVSSRILPAEAAATFTALPVVPCGTCAGMPFVAPMYISKALSTFAFHGQSSHSDAAVYVAVRATWVPPCVITLQNAPSVLAGARGAPYLGSSR